MFVVAKSGTGTVDVGSFVRMLQLVQNGSGRRISSGAVSCFLLLYDAEKHLVDYSKTARTATTTKIASKKKFAALLAKIFEDCIAESTV